MYTVLIVDDEPAILMGIHKTFDKIDLGFEVLWEVQSSKNAFDIICNQRPDVVVTDIRMPVINGIQLMKMTREQNIDTEFVVISGFEEFQYAKEALNVGAFGYLSKPIQREEVYELLMRLTAYMEQKILGKDIRIYEDIIYKKINIDSLFPQKLYKYYQFAFAFSEDENIKMTKQALSEENTNIIAITLGVNKRLFIINTNCDVTESFKDIYSSSSEMVNISLGISDITENTEDAANLIKQAEIASYSSFIYGSHNIYKYTNNKNSLKKIYNSIKDDSIKNILDYIHVNYCDPNISLNKISETFYLNMAYCSVLFKKCTGMTYSEYLTSIRMTKACELLKDSTLSVEEVSYKIGYDDYFYFNRVFKKNIGITPANYKRLNS
jgi:two-component system response regulator YesN